MEIIGSNLITAIADVIGLIISIYTFIIIGRVLISWVSPDPYNPIVRFLYMATEPILGFARRYIPPIGGTLDISPIVVLILIQFLGKLIVDTLYQLASSI